jgi:hypothetical protein
MFTRKVYTTRKEKTVDLIIGIVIFVVLNVIVGALYAGLIQLSLYLTPSGSSSTANILQVLGFAMNCLPIVLNIGLMVFFAFTRPWIALGMLAALGVLLAISLCLGVVAGAVCLIALSQMGQ